MNKKTLIVFMIAIFAVCFFAKAALCETVIYHEDLDEKIVTDDNIDRLYIISFFEMSGLILHLQCSAEVITPEYFKIIDAFLKKGGAVWIYDSALAQNFGFIKSDFSGKDVQGRKVKTKYSHSDEYPAYLCTAHPASSNSVLNGVKSVRVDCLTVGNDLYSAVKPGPQDNDFYPLLKVNDKDYYVCAYRVWGRGKVVFIPRINENMPVNKQFVANIKEFSRGFSVPSERNQNQFGCKINFASGKEAQGSITNKTFDIFVNNETKKCEAQNILRIKFAQTVSGFDEIYLKDGTVFKGVISIEDIEFTPDGAYKVKYGKNSIGEIVFE